MKAKKLNPLLCKISTLLGPGLFLSLTGRTKDIIKKGGSNIHAIEVEQILLEKDEILDAAVFGVPHASVGEEVIAAIVTKDNENIDELSLRIYLGERIGNYKVPARILVVANFPKNEKGQILKNELKQELLPKLQDVLFTVSKETELSKAEELVSRITAQILNLQKPDLTKDFFSLGGSSVDLLELINSVNYELGLEISGNEFFEAPDLKTFASYLEVQFPSKFNSGTENNLSVATAKSTNDTIPTTNLSNQFLRNQLQLVKQWGGIRKREDSMILGKNLSGKKKPLFWCFQSYEEFETLALTLGSDQPLYGMRSGHMIIKMKEVGESGIPQHYAREMMELKPDGPFILGGNCQGGMVAWHTAKELVRQNRSVELLFLMEINPKEKFDSRVALLYGEESTRINPYLCEENPEAVWNAIYKNYSVDIIRGRHGQYFTPQNINVLASKLKARLETCVAPVV